MPSSSPPPAGRFRESRPISLPSRRIPTTCRTACATFHRSLDTLLGGLRKYQNPALADLIQSVAAEDQEDLGKLQDYLLELANQKEQEYLVVDHEAQRCRAILSREPATPRKNAPKE